MVNGGVNREMARVGSFHAVVQCLDAVVMRSEALVRILEAVQEFFHAMV